MDTANPTPKYSPEKYSAMSVWDIYQMMTTLVGVRHFYTLSACADKTEDLAVLEWAEFHEAATDEELLAMSTNLAGRLNLSVDDQDVRDMAFARVDGFVPSGMWHDGRLLRMKAAADFRKVGA